MESDDVGFQKSMYTHGIDATPQNILQLMTFTPCIDLVKKQEPIILDSKMSIEDACDVRRKKDRTYHYSHRVLFPFRS
jgi:hypothetical protein